MGMVHEPRRVLLTGGCGFIGANLVRFLLEADPLVHVCNIDLLTYAGNPQSVADVAEKFGDRYQFFQKDIADEAAISALFAEFFPDTVIHLAAESHVDRSIDGPKVFVRTNVQGTLTLLEAARASWKGRNDVRFHHVSTDEVFGSLHEDGKFHEETPYDPSSPYSASKAASDHLVRAWGRTYGLPFTLSNCSNNYGPYQFPEKLIPLIILRALRGEPLPVYGTGSNVRDWLFVEDHCAAIDRIVRQASDGTTWLVGGNQERTNLEMVKAVCASLDRLRPSGNGPYERLISFVTDRPGHDFRYAIDAGRLERELGWKPRFQLSEGLERTIRWYLDHPGWVEGITSGAYRQQRLGLEST